MIHSLTAGYNKIIIAPLNWGLGHATRCIPLINTLLKAGKEVILASDGEALELLQEEFPQLNTEVLPAYNVLYKSDKVFQLVLSNAPKIFSAIRRERKVADQLYNKHKPDLIISDSRFGFRSDKVKSVIISHQLQLVSSNAFVGHWMNLVNTRLLNKFDGCWIPDDEQHSLSGELSQNPKIKSQSYLGTLSRLSPDVSSQKIYDVTMILSGPEPARTNLEENLIKDFNTSTNNFCLVRGTTRLAPLALPTNWTVIDRANSTQINRLLLSSHRIISRSGYTSLMDYKALGISAELIPTKGQSEQEYLAEYVNGREGFSIYRG